MNISACKYVEIYLELRECMVQYVQKQGMHYLAAKVGNIMNSYQIIDACVRDTFNRVVWSHKIQEKQADIYQHRHRVFATVSIISSSLTSVGVVSLIFVDQLWVKLISAGLSFISVFVNSYFKSFDLVTMIKAHKTTAVQLLSVRDSLTCLLMKIKLEMTPAEELIEVYEDLLKEIHNIYENAPNTSNTAVKMARKALQVTGDNTFSDDEADSYLPTTLKKE